MNTSKTLAHRGVGRLWFGKGLFAVTAWGASFVATRVALRSFHPFGLVSFRLLTGVVLLVMLARLSGRRIWPARADLGVCGFLGLVLGAHLSIQAFGLQFTSAINTGWIIGFIPVLIALGAQWFLKQPLRPIGWCGVALGAAGVLIVTMRSPPDFAQARWGDLLQLISCVTWTVYTLAATGPVSRNGALRVSTAAMIVAAFIVSMASLRTGFVHDVLTSTPLLNALFLGVACNGLAFFLWFQAVNDQGPTRVGALLYLEPFVTVAVAAALINEPITINAIAGGLTVLAGVYLVSKGAPRSSL